MDAALSRDSQEEVDSEAESSTSNKTVFLEKVRLSNAACQSGDFLLAVKLYTEAINLDPSNHVLYSNRSAAYIKLGKYIRALQDAIKARELNPKWPKAYYRQGVALQYLGRHADALAAFASGLAQDTKSIQLLAGLVEAAMKSPLRATLEPTYRQLQTMRLDKSPFVITSVIGQELLASGHHAASVVVLESALRIGTCSLKLRGSVFSALSSAYWALNTLDKAIAYMQQDLAVAKSLGDQVGECRAHGNLGSAYFSKGNFKEALSSHRYQLVLAMKCKDTQAAAWALTSLGHVYTAIGDFPNALASHKQCVQLVRQINDSLQEAREIGNVGAVYLAMGDFDKAVECHLEHLRLAKQLGNKVEEARAYSNLGSSHHFRRSFEQAITFHNHVLHIAQELGDKNVEARAYAGLGHAARCMGDFQQAKKWHEKQLEMALSTKDKVTEGRACSNLGIVYHLLRDFDAALKLHQAHLNIASASGDRAGMGRAYGNIGNAFSAMGQYEQAIKFHKQELTISKEVNDRNAEASTHGNLAVAYQALGMYEMALMHYHSHLSIARELKDTAGEACALCNLGNCHSSRGEFAQAVPYYESFLQLAQETSDLESEAKACHFLGYAHYCLGNYKEAINYYEHDLTLAKDLQDRLNMGRAYCNLGLSHLALGNFPAALECQKYFLAIAQMTRHLQGIFRALGNLGDVLTKMNNTPEAVKMYQKQLIIAKKSQDKALEAAAYGALGMCHRQMKNYDKALAYHTQELALRQELNDLKGECKAHGHLGAAHMSLGNYLHAVKCYEEHLERARELQDCSLETQALGNLGIARLNMRHFEDAIGFFEQQLALLEQLGTATALVDKGRAYGSLGDCYDALGDYEEAVKCHEQFLAIALKSQSLRDQERAYRSLANSHHCLGNLQQALVCFEKRLVVSHELGSIRAKAVAYGELGNIHSQLGNFEQSISCLEHQMALAKELKDRQGEASAACGLGSVYQQMGEHERSLHYHQLDLSIAEETGNMSAQGRAYGNLGVAHESLGNFDQAISCQEQHLSIAAQINDKTAKILAYSSLGRIHHAVGNTTQAVTYLQQGLQIAEQLGQREDEAKIRYRLGLALWGNSELEGAQQQLYRAADLFESIRREARGPTDYKLSLFDLQTASYQALQRVLVNLSRHEEALVVAERGRTRAFVDLLLERQTANVNSIVSFSPNSVDQMLDIINKQKASVIYYSIAAGYLYTWVIVPNKGIVTFHETSVSDVETDKTSEQDSTFPLPSSLLEQYVASVREALGVDTLTGGQETGTQSETESEAGDFWQQHLEELGDRLNQESDRTGFLRMVNRNHLFNSSNYSLSSLFSLGSLSGSIASSSTSRPGSVGSRRHQWQGPAPLHALYNLLIAPVEEFLPSGPDPPELLLVLDGDLFLVPFAMLKNETSDDYLCERYSLIRIPSISALKSSQRSRMSAQRQNNTNGVSERLSAVVVGNPYLPSAISEQWGWTDIPHAQSEADLVSEMLGTKPIIGSQATKEAVLNQLSQAECIHLATHVSWKLSAIVFSPGEYAEMSSRRFAGSGHVDGAAADGEYHCEPSPELASTTDIPPLSEFLLTAADILNLQLSALLVVISSCHTRSHHGRAHSDGVVGLTRALLAAGAQCVLVSLWPVPDTALKLLYRTFYSSLLQGSCVSMALADAMRTIQATRHFSHPANWASFLLVGSDVRLNSQVALMGQALGELLKVPDACRDALRVVLHLVEKSLQRIHRGHKNAMYTTQKSIENKVGPVGGWKELLISVGFRFEPASNGLPACVFFPQTDPGERLTQCSASLQALLGLSSVSLTAISKLLSSPDYADDIIQLMQQVIAQSSKKDLDAECVECPVSVKLWSVPGCHELLASLGFDLMEVGCDGVILRMGKQANRRVIQFALQALLAVFDTSEAPKSICFEESSSMESLESIPSNSCVPPVPTVPFPPRLKLSNVSLGKGSGAFSCYVRSRGEPDGRTGSEQKGRESDTFTPSPVDSLSKPYTMLQSSTDSASVIGSRNAADSLLDSNQPFGDGAINADNSAKRPDSSSSASSVTDWDSGQSTVRRQNVLRGADNPSKSSPNSHLRGSLRNPLCAQQDQIPPSLKPISNNAMQGLEIYQSPWCPDFQNSTTCKTSFLPQEKFSSIIRAPQTALRTIFGFKDKSDGSCSSDRREKLRQAKDVVSGADSSMQIVVAGCDKKIDSLDANVQNLTGRDRPTNYVQTLDPSKILSNQRFVKSASKRPLHGFEHPSRETNSHVEYASSRLRQLSQESPISDVYHDRSLGLGLAPSLSAILTSDGWNNHQGGADACLQNECNDLIPQTHMHPSKKTVWTVKKPLVPPGFGHLSCWNNLSLPNNEKDSKASNSLAELSTESSSKAGGLFLNDVDVGQVKNAPHVRDDGDGRSVKEMSCPDQPDGYRESTRSQKDCCDSLGILSCEVALKDCLVGVDNGAFGSSSHADVLGIEKDKSAGYTNVCSLLASEESKGDDALILHRHHLNRELEKLSLAEREEELCRQAATSDSETSDADSGISQRVSIATVRRNPKGGMAATLHRPRGKRDKSPSMLGTSKYPDNGKLKT